MDAWNKCIPSSTWWYCDNCGHQGPMSLNIDHCPGWGCGHQRCVNCCHQRLMPKEQRGQRLRHYESGGAAGFSSREPSLRKHQTGALLQRSDYKDRLPTSTAAAVTDTTLTNLHQREKARDEAPIYGKPSPSKQSSSSFSGKLNSGSATQSNELCCHYGKKRLENPNFLLHGKFNKECHWKGYPALRRLQDHLRDHRSIFGQADGNSDSQWNSIKELIKVKGTARGLKGAQKAEHERQRWFDIWNLLFPDDVAPTNPYASLGATPEAPYDAEGLIEIFEETLGNNQLSREQMEQVLKALRETMQRACGDLGTVKVNVSSSRKFDGSFPSKRDQEKNDMAHTIFPQQDGQSTQQLSSHIEEPQRSLVAPMQDSWYSKMGGSGTGCINPLLLVSSPSTNSGSWITPASHCLLPVITGTQSQVSSTNSSNQDAVSQSQSRSPYLSCISSDANWQDPYDSATPFNLEQTHLASQIMENDLEFDYSAPSLVLYPIDSFKSDCPNLWDNTDLDAILEQEVNSDARGPLEKPCHRNRGLQNMNWGNEELCK